MRKDIDVCDYCGKRTDDYYAEIGWIHIGEDSITVTNGRNPNGVATPERYTRGLTSPRGIDFCSVQCFLKWLYLSDETRGKGSDKETDEQCVKFAKKMGVTP